MVEGEGRKKRGEAGEGWNNMSYNKSNNVHGYQRSPFTRLR